ncbi:S-adenosylmethionine decarboxylase [Patescibacteria group bacterium]|nr:S-adenosylmethionine decarboxylase [Patescibacteria group bacterium]
MTQNFPFYNRWSAEITVTNDQIIDNDYLDLIAQKIISDLKLTVVSKSEHLFPKYGGQTKVYIISQSHLIIHTWPEYSSLHIDLMTCSPGLDTLTVQNVIRSLPNINQPIFP